MWRRCWRGVKPQVLRGWRFNDDVMRGYATSRSSRLGGRGLQAIVVGMAVATSIGVVGMASVLQQSSVAKCSAAVPEKRGRYVLNRELGRGGFAVVRLAVDTKTNELVAAKIFDPRVSSQHAIKVEIETLQHLGKHRNIVSLRDVLELPDQTIMFTDLVEGGELFDFIVEMGSMSERDASRFLQDVCQGLMHIHRKGICHRDLKPENVLLSTKAPTAALKIADFGLSRRQHPGASVIEDHPNGTIVYWAPEIIKHQPQSHAVDIWAFGVLAYIMLTGVHPFDPRGNLSDAEIVAKIATGEFDRENPWYKGLSAGAKDFLDRLMSVDPVHRLTAEQALHHPWLRGETSSTSPLPDGHTERIQSYQRLQQLRANILTVVMGVGHAKFEAHNINQLIERDASTELPTVNLDMFRESFMLFDKDESGYIDVDELRQVMISLGQHLTRRQLTSILHEADTDGDGKISFREFVDMMNQRLFDRGDINEADLKAAFEVFDVNHDHYISSSELEHVLHILSNATALTSNEVNKILEVVDTNGDGKLDFDEFCAIMKSNLSSNSHGVNSNK